MAKTQFLPIKATEEDIVILKCVEFCMFSSSHYINTQLNVVENPQNDWFLDKTKDNEFLPQTQIL